MQLVAASKLRKAQEAAIGPREYLEATRTIVNELSMSNVSASSKLFSTNNAKHTLAIVISSDRGLAGAYNSNVIKSTAKYLREGSSRHKIISVGRHASLFVAKINGADDTYNLEEVDEIAAYSLSVTDVDSGLAQPILKEAIDLFISGQVSEVYVIYTKFISTVKQETVTEKILPLTSPESQSAGVLEKTYEPSGEYLVDYVSKLYLEASLTQFILESIASEHASRMLAMKNATDNASDLIDDLTLAFNNARQAAITQELAEISGGAQAIK
jgi:F-type H+-transporting ATPase subunit gamma